MPKASGDENVVVVVVAAADADEKNLDANGGEVEQMRQWLRPEELL